MKNVYNLASFYIFKMRLWDIWSKLKGTDAWQLLELVILRLLSFSFPTDTSSLWRQAREAKAQAERFSANSDGAQNKGPGIWIL